MKIKSMIYKQKIIINIWWYFLLKKRTDKRQSFFLILILYLIRFILMVLEFLVLPLVGDSVIETK
jgi:hypothetical protein